MTNTVALNPSALRAAAIYNRLMALPRPEGMSNNEWAKKAGVNTSFFTNLRKGSEPSVGNLRAVLKAVNVSLPEFFAHEANGRLISRPTQEQLEAALRAVMPGLPRNPDRRVEYLAEALSAVLALQEKPHPNVVEIEIPKRGDEQKGQPARETKKPTGSSRQRTG